jgi:NAD(P)-dependent dehydrogenase (short-subunit alcohol dehydrogenase family)
MPAASGARSVPADGHLHRPRGHHYRRRAVDYWRAEHGTGRPVAARIINISSGAGLQGAAHQASYSTAKGGIASLTLTQAAEVGTAIDALLSRRRAPRAVWNT